ncbi:MAG: fatty acid desaturase [Longimicrobiales bacterium]|nr:fatty acid desaturase [Longimicrobiales bacterium]
MSQHHDHAPHDDIVYPSTIPFALVHLAALGSLWTGFPAFAVWTCVVLYLVRMWAVTAAYHRYFSHRSYKTSRVGQFVLALLAQTSAQRGALWWAAIHRHHHLHSDTPEDVHSPRHHGFLYAHVGWIFNAGNWKPDYGTIRDLAKYPELRWLDRYSLVPAVALAMACFAFGGWPGLFVGFFLSTVVLYHGTFAINSMAHEVGNQRYLTGDDSRNHWFLALVTLGEGWHNNHHHYQSSTRQGFKWWEIDITYYILKMLSWVGLVWDLREPPLAIVRGDTPVGRKVVEKVAQDLAASVTLEWEAVTARVRDAWAESHTLDELTERARRARDQVETMLAELALPHLPTVPELRERAEELFQESPSLDEIVARAHQLMRLAVAARVLAQAGA